MPILKKAYIVLSLVLFGAIAGLVFMTIRYNRLFSYTSAWVIHTTVVLKSAQNALAGLHEFETGRQSPAPLKTDLETLRALIADNAAQIARVDSVRTLLAFLEGARPGGISATPAVPVINTDLLRDILLRVQADESRLLASREIENASSAAELRTYILILLGLIFALLCVSIYIIRYNLSRRRKVEKDLLESENRFDLFVQHVTDYAIYKIDPEGRIMSWNRGAQYIKGYTAEEVLGRSFTLFYTDEEIAGGEPVFNLKKAARDGHYECIGLRKRKDGSSFYADVVFTTVYDRKGKVSGYIKITKDITAQIKTQEEMRHALKREKELNEMKSRFVTLASHEFKTPLSVILSSTNLIEKYNSSEQQSDRLRHIHRIKSNVNNLKQLLIDFLSVERLEEGAVRNNPVLSDLEKIAREAILDMEGMWKYGQPIALSVTGLSRLVYVDHQLIRNILNNLLSNAIKYSPENSPVRLLLHFDADTVQLSVVDTGIGIPADEQQHLFQRFFRAHNTTGISGTGLGLSIVKRYLDLMGGSISVESEPGKGSVFTVTLPANAVQDAGIPGQVSPASDQVHPPA